MLIQELQSLLSYRTNMQPMILISSPSDITIGMSPWERGKHLGWAAANENPMGKTGAAETFAAIENEKPFERRKPAAAEHNTPAPSENNKPAATPSNTPTETETFCCSTLAQRQPHNSCALSTGRGAR